MRRLLVVMAKEPEAGRVKTRLCPPLSPQLAARCHEAFVTDTVERLGAATAGKADRELAVAPAGAAPRLQALAAANGWRCVDQQGEDLGARMRERLAAGVGEGAAVVLVGSDAPDLPLERVFQAFAELERRTVVVGPATDGGYYLIGCRGGVPEIFGREMVWGGPDLLRQTLERLAAAGETWGLLDTWPDVDDWDGLVALARRLRTAEPHRDGIAPRSTLRLLADLTGLGLSL